MEEASLHTTRKHLFTTTDKHGVPPTKRLFKVAMLDLSLEFIGHLGMSGDPRLSIVVRPLQSSALNVKEEDSITDVENAVLDLGVVNPLYQSLYVLRPSKLCARAQSEDDMPSRTLACMEYTRWVFCKLCGRPKVRHLVYLTKRHDFRPRSFQEFVSNHDSIPQLAHMFVGDTRWRDDSIPQLATVTVVQEESAQG
ncbi:hypothetical protein Tco_0602456 [Tanacetum coccineum]